MYIAVKRVVKGRYTRENYRLEVES